MVVTWVTLLKTVPWTDVIANAPAITDGAKKLWNTVAKKVPPAPAEASTAKGSSTAPGVNQADLLAGLQARLDATQATVTELHGQMLASSELIKALADQNAELVKRIEAHRIRLLWVSAGLGVTVVGAVVAFARLAAIAA